MNGKILNEGTTENLMEKYKASNIEDLFIEIILSEDEQRDSVNTTNTTKY